MAKAQFKWSKNFMTKVRTSPEAVDLLKGIGEEMANAAGPGHEVSSMITRGKGRARVTITASTQRARKANADSNVLLRALGRQGG